MAARYTIAYHLVERVKDGDTYLFCSLDCMKSQQDAEWVSEMDLFRQF